MLDVSFDRNDPKACRQAIRSGLHKGKTRHLARDFVQANLVVLPREYAYDFLTFCQRNPKPCPLLAVSEPGDPRFPGLGNDIDIRTDLPGYRIFHDGTPNAERVSDISDVWRDDLVSFALGCSFSFEQALLDEGLDHQPSMGYNTILPTVPAGPFHGGTVVTMRAFSPQNAIRAIQVTSRMPSVHGAPIHIGDPSVLGISDLTQPDYGEIVPVEKGLIPLYWACGITPQLAIQNARIPFAVTHSGGYMLITDLLNKSLAVI